MTREEMWKEFENQLKREVHTPITMSYDDSIRLAESGIEETVAKWKERLDQERRTGHWINMLDLKRSIYQPFYKCSKCDYLELVKFNFCPVCGARMFKESEVDNANTRRGN